MARGDNRAARHTHQSFAATRRPRVKFRERSRPLSASEDRSSQRAGEKSYAQSERPDRALCEAYRVRQLEPAR